MQGRATSLDKRCIECGGPFQTSETHSWQKYCSPKCGKRYRRKHNKNHKHTCSGCGEEFETHRIENKYCSRECFQLNTPRVVLVEWQCLSCGEEMETQTNDAGSYCSDECSERGADLVCSWCHESYYGHQLSEYCSDECSAESDKDKALIGARARHYAQWPLRECGECGDEFRPAYGSKRRSFCSRDCARAYGRRKYRVGGTFNQRARKVMRDLYGFVPPLMYEPTNREDILIRDGWRCQICGGAIPKDAEHPDDDSPAIDHVVALANGGAHTPENMQAAHFMCNSYKGAHDDQYGGAPYISTKTALISSRWPWTHGRELDRKVRRPI